MRISDWSSDVCSSDLVAVLVIGQFLFTVIRSPIVRLAIALLFAIPAGIAGYHAVQGVIGLAIDPGMMLSTLSWIGGGIIAVTAWIRLASLEISQPAQGAARSEEHTSELQSLMRISYAVFCLKKQKIKIKKRS